MRTLFAALGAVLLLAAPADAARLRTVAKLKATAKGTQRAADLEGPGERRDPLRGPAHRAASARVARNRTTLHRPQGEARQAYRYSVRPCRGKRCADARARCASRCRRQAVRAAAAPPAPAPPGDAFAGSPVIGDCPVFPKDNAWNTDVSQAPVDTSHDYIGSLGSMVLWPDFGGDGAYGIPYVSVPFSQPLVPISFEVADESDPGPYPVPLDAPVEGGGDRHVLTLRQGDCKLFELYAAERSGRGWHAYSGAVWDLQLQRAAPGALDVRRRRGPADPARASPAATRPTRGAINHALRITVPTTQKAYIHPATHWASSNTDPDQPPMGLRVRLKASYDISGLRGQAKVVAQALKTYGALVADNAGSPRVYVSRRQRPAAGTTRTSTGSSRSRRARWRPS